MNYVLRHGKRIAVETIRDPGTSSPRKRKPFKAQFVMIPLWWAEALQQSNSARAYQLAVIILFEAFKLEAFKRKGEEIILSSTVTRMPRCTKMKAVRELVDMGLIEAKLIGNQAARVIISTTKNRE